MNLLPDLRRFLTRAEPEIDPDSDEAAAAYVADERIYQQTHVPVPIETRGLVVEWIAATQELTLWASTQTPHELRAFAA